MTDGPTEELEDRVLVLAPTGRDAAATRDLLAAAGVRSLLCASIADVCWEAGRGAGAALITAEAVLGDTSGLLAETLKAQPPWSDLPLILLTPPGPDSPRLLQALDAVGPMTLMKRPVQVSTLVSAVRTALRDRRRQYAVRGLLAERGRAAEDLRAERERYRVTLSSIGDAVIATDTEGRVTFLNSVARELTQWDEDAARGRPLEEVFHILNERTRKPVENPAVRALRDEVVVGLANHTVLVGRDGAERPIDDSAAPIRGGGDEVVGAVLVFRDITERKRAEQQVRQTAEANAKFRSMFEQATQFAGVLTVDGTVVEANRLCLDACGFTREEVMGRPFWECGWWNRSAPLAEMVRVACAQAAGARPFRAETKYFVADGGERVVDLAVSPVTDDDGRVLFLTATGTDVTERRRAEDALRDADRMKDDFIALLAHELRNPLAPIRNGLQVLRLSDERAVRERSQDMMERQLSHMVRLIDDLLDVSRISRNKMELRRSRVALSDVVRSAVETARPAIEAAGHELTVTLPPGPVFLDADLTRLSQVLSNLLTNSAKYTERGGKIWVSAGTSGSSIVVSVRDTGIGIPAEALPTIFEMFSQVDRSIERSTGGLGIGLALVKGLVEMHGGTVTARSNGAGHGSEFTVTLPTVTGSPAPVGRSPVDRSAAPGPKRRVLVVDDNRDGAESLATMLELTGNDVALAHDGVEAVQRAEQFHPQVILMDVGMPRLNGLEAARRIRGADWGRDVTIIALTGWGQENDRERSREAGCDGHLVKPVALDDLWAVLGELQRRGR